MSKLLLGLIGAGIQRSLSPDHEVATVNGARAALKLLDQGNRFDLILCDVMMPELDGYGVLQALRNDRRVVHSIGQLGLHTLIVHAHAAHEIGRPLDAWEALEDHVRVLLGHFQDVRIEVAEGGREDEAGAVEPPAHLHGGAQRDGSGVDAAALMWDAIERRRAG